MLMQCSAAGGAVVKEGDLSERGYRRRARRRGTKSAAGDAGDGKKKNMETGRALGWVGLGAEGGSETKTLVFCVWGGLGGGGGDQIDMGGGGAA